MFCLDLVLQRFFACFLFRLFASVMIVVCMRVQCKTGPSEVSSLLAIGEFDYLLDRHCRILTSSALLRRGFRMFRICVLARASFKPNLTFHKLSGLCCTQMCQAPCRPFSTLTSGYFSRPWSIDSWQRPWLTIRSGLSRKVTVTSGSIMEYEPRHNG